ncbi:MAG TPA: hypothetical protein VHX39_22635, partial [Acetobacteraceae bacterium]|nr:hypothetical protein [Acetobacteraceae bacterium]
FDARRIALRSMTRITGDGVLAAGAGAGAPGGAAFAAKVESVAAIASAATDETARAVVLVVFMDLESCPCTETNDL